MKKQTRELSDLEQLLLEFIYKKFCNNELTQEETKKLSQGGIFRDYYAVLGMTKATGELTSSILQNDSINFNNIEKSQSLTRKKISDKIEKIRNDSRYLELIEDLDIMTKNDFSKFFDLYYPVNRETKSIIYYMIYIKAKRFNVFSFVDITRIYDVMMIHDKSLIFRTWLYTRDIAKTVENIMWVYLNAPDKESRRTVWLDANKQAKSFNDCKLMYEAAIDELEKAEAFLNLNDWASNEEEKDYVSQEKKKNNKN